MVILLTVAAILVAGGIVRVILSPANSLGEALLQCLWIDLMIDVLGELLSGIADADW